MLSVQDYQVLAIQIDRDMADATVSSGQPGLISLHLEKSDTGWQIVTGD